MVKTGIGVFWVIKSHDLRLSVANAFFFEYFGAMEEPKKIKKTINLTPEDVKEFTAVMRSEGFSDLAPWMVAAIRRYVAGHDEYREQIDTIERVVTDIQKRMATKTDVTPEGPQGGW